MGGFNRFTVALSSALLLGISGSASASISMLITMPIADVLGHREVAYTIAAEGTEQKLDKKISWGHGFAIGIGDRLELGFDNDFEGVNEWSAKFLHYEGPKGSTALSAGVMGVNETGDAVTKFVVGRVDFPGFRLHGGYLHDDRHRLIVGIDGDLGRDWSYMVDYVSGPENLAWAGINIPTPFSGVVVTPALGIPVSKREAFTYNVGATYGFRF